MCSAQYQYRSGASHLERQHLQLFVHVAVKKNFVAASAGVKSCLALGLALPAGCLGMPSVLQAASARPRPSRFCFRNQGIEGDNDVLCLPRSAVGFGAKLRSHHTLAASSKRGIGCLQGGGLHHHRRAIEVAQSKRYVQTWGCPHASRRDTHHTEAGHSSRRHAAAAPQHIIILYFIAICRAPKASCR